MRSSRRCGTGLPEAEFVVPGGGYFLWIDLPEDYDTVATAPGRPRARACRSSPGATPCSRGAGSSLRLSFASVPADQIAEGVERLARALELGPAPPAPPDPPPPGGWAPDCQPV